MKSTIWWFIFIILVYALVFMYRLKKSREKIIEFQNSLKVGDKIIFSSGMFGAIKYFDGNFVGVEVSTNVVIKVDKYYIEKII